MSILASAMTGIGGEQVALCDVAVDAVLRDLLCEVTVGQTYRNDEQVNIEAVYTFPLPLDAVLLDLAVEIGGKMLQGIVVGKKEAEEKYEDAVSDGDAAVMLEALEARREPSRRERRIDLPEAYARLLQVVADDPSRLTPTSALDLLHDAALVADFDDLFRHAGDLGLDVRAIAAIVLATILGGPLGEYVPLDARPSVASLQEYAEQATRVLGDMRRHAANLLRALEAVRALDVLRDDAAGRIGDVLVRPARLDELLDHLRKCEGRIVARLVEHRLARA